MKATEIPFVKLVGIKQEDNNLSLNINDNLLNHIKTIHASAQFTLAETRSGTFLQELFPNLENQVIPVLRDSQIKFKKPAIEKIIAFAKTSDENIAKFKEQFNKKGRATITVDVEIKDVNGVLTSLSTFNWFVQKV